MDIREFKAKIQKFSDDQLVNEYFALHDELAFDLVSMDWDKQEYDKYWKYDRPMFQEQLRQIENELSYRNINL